MNKNDEIESAIVDSIDVLYGEPTIFEYDETAI